MDLRQSTPEYLVNRNNTILQIAFAVIFAFVFINIYLPFGAENWYKINEWQFLLFTGVVVLTGMISIIITRLTMFYLKRSHEITLALYIWMITIEVFLMSLFFTLFELFILKDERDPITLFLNALQNTVLILLIPYLISSLFFAWSDIKKKFESVIQQFRTPSEVFIPFHDEKGKLRITLKNSDILYLESKDNYVSIHYNDVDSNRTKTFMVRNTLKTIEQELETTTIYRCHRSYAINTNNVKLVTKGKKNYFIHLKNMPEMKIPISKSYEEYLLNNLKMFTNK